jgi:ribose 5-phosphate isomerase B
MKVYFAADHAGFELKNELLNFVRGELGFEVEDCGAFEYDSQDDYPFIIASAADPLSNDIANGRESRAILIGGSGQGEAMVANRFLHVRASVYYGPAQAMQTDAGGNQIDMITSVREHNDSNALSLGARFIGAEEAKVIVRKWLGTRFSHDERHERRIAEMDTLKFTSQENIPPELC